MALHRDTAYGKVRTESLETLKNKFRGGKSDTITFNKKDALMKLNFDNLSVVRETKLKEQLKALVFSFHLRGRAAL